MKNKLQIAIALGLMCILLTCSIVVQLNTIKEATKIVGTSYAEQGLKDEVLRKKEEYERLYRELEEKEQELEKARQESAKENSRTSELQSELDNANKLLGLTELTGEGIILTVKDGDTLTKKESALEESKMLIHDQDLIELVNELKNSGAEAISINEQRIVYNTAITCSGAIITINGVRLSSPFEIKAIGNTASLKGGITRIGSYLSRMEDEGIIASLEESNSVQIAKYTGVNTPKYMQTIKSR